MAYISEIKYSGYGEGSDDEFVEIVLMPGDDPADFTVGFYNANGFLRDGASSFFTGGEITLSEILTATGGNPGSVASGVGGLDLQVMPHPDNPDWTVFVIPSTLSAATTGASAEAVALTNTTTNTVIGAYDVGTNSNAQQFQEGAATGATPTASGDGSGGTNSIQWDHLGNSYLGTADPGDSVICLAEGTLIETALGPRLVETLDEGCLLPVLDGTLRPVRAVLETRISADKATDNQHRIRIRANALAPSVPKRDLLVSCQHRILVRSAIAQRIFGREEVLVAAKFLLALPGVDIMPTDADFSYFHIVMDSHDIITAEGAPTETLLLGDHSREMISEMRLAALCAKHRHILTTNSPDHPARFIPPAKAQRSLIERHRKNRKPILAPRSGSPLMRAA